MKPMTKLTLVLGVVLYAVSSFHVVNAYHAKSLMDANDDDCCPGHNPGDKEDIEAINEFLNNLEPVKTLIDSWLTSISKNLQDECDSNKDLGDRLNEANPDVQKLVGSLILDINDVLKEKTKLLSDVLENTVGVTENFKRNVLKDLSSIVQTLLQNLSKLLRDLLGGTAGLLGDLTGILG